MKKNLTIAAILVVIGVVIGVWLCDTVYSHQRGVEPQKDTVVIERKIRYTPLELKAKTVRLDVPQISRMSMVLIPYDSVTTVYRDSIRYVSLRRQYFFTKTEEAEIWHSGIDSTIDSLNVVAKVVNISKTETRRPKDWAFSLGVGANIGKANTRYISPSIGAEISYKRWSLTGDAGIDLNVGENMMLRPTLYYEIGFRYSLIKR